MVRGRITAVFVAACLPFFIGCSKEQERQAPPKAESPASSETALAPQNRRPASTLASGAISGKVIFTGKYSPANLSVGKDNEVCGKSKSDPSLIVGSQGELKNAVAQITDMGREKTPAAKEVVLDQVKCEYVPHVLAIPAGSTVTIKNSDGILHNVHTLSKINSSFNRAQPKFLKEIKESFSKPEIIPVRCDVHGWMSGWVFVAAHPYFDVSGDDGTFKLADVPVGDHTLEVWHESLGKQTVKVQVKANETAEVAVEFAAKR